MTQQTINLGPTNNPSSGDSIRIALTKSNSNFTDLYTQVASLNTITAASIGAVAVASLGVDDGVATLDSTGKLTASQIPSSLSGTSSVNFGASVVTNSLSNNQIIVYSSSTSEWQNESRPYNPSGCYIGTPNNPGLNLYAFIALNPASFPINFSGSVAAVLTAPVGAAATFNIHQNNSIIGTISFAANSKIGTFATVNTITPTVVESGDVFTITSNAINNFNTLIFTLSGTLT
jgi:hypothetical protein